MSQDVMGPWSKAGHNLLLPNPLSSRLVGIYRVSPSSLQLIYMQRRPPGSSVRLPQHRMCRSLGTWVGHPGLASPAMALQTLPGKGIPCYGNKKTLMKRHAGNVEAELMLLL